MIGYRPQTDAVSGHGCYLVAQGTGGAAYYPNITASGAFRIFQFKTRLRLLQTAAQKAYFGLFASTAAAAAPHGAYLEYDPAIGANWQCTVRNGGSLTRTDTGVAATASYATLEVSATISGTLACKAGGVTVTTAAAFPAAPWFGFYNADSGGRGETDRDFRCAAQGRRAGTVSMRKSALSAACFLAATAAFAQITAVE